MKIIKIAGIALIVLGIAAFTYQGITYTKRDKVADIGSLEITIDKKKTIPLPPAVDALMIISGITLLVLSIKAK